MTDLVERYQGQTEGLATGTAAQVAAVYAALRKLP